MREDQPKRELDPTERQALNNEFQELTQEFSRLAVRPSEQRTDEENRRMSVIVARTTEIEEKLSS